MGVGLKLSKSIPIHSELTEVSLRANKLTSRLGKVWWSNLREKCLTTHLTYLLTNRQSNSIWHNRKDVCCLSKISPFTILVRFIVLAWPPSLHWNTLARSFSKGRSRRTFSASSHPHAAAACLRSSRKVSGSSVEAIFMSVTCGTVAGDTAEDALGRNSFWSPASSFPSPEQGQRVLGVKFGGWWRGTERFQFPWLRRRIQQMPGFSTRVEPRCVRVWRKIRETGGILTELQAHVYSDCAYQHLFKTQQKTFLKKHAASTSSGSSSRFSLCVSVWVRLASSAKWPRTPSLSRGL